MIYLSVRLYVQKFIDLFKGRVIATLNVPEGGEDRE